MVLPFTSMDRSLQAWLTMTSPSPPPSQATRGGGAKRGWVTGTGHSRGNFSDWMILTVSIGMVTGWRLRQDIRSGKSWMISAAVCVWCSAQPCE